MGIFKNNKKKEKKTFDWYDSQLSLSQIGIWKKKIVTKIDGWIWDGHPHSVYLYLFSSL